MTLEEFYAICDAIEPDEYGCHHYPKAAHGFSFRVIIYGRQVGVHRLALERKLGRPIQPGLYALHHCDYASCVNPDHIYEGTNADNQRDRKLRDQDSYAYLRSKLRREHLKKKFQEDPVYRAKILANLQKAFEANEARRKKPGPKPG